MPTFVVGDGCGDVVVDAIGADDVHARSAEVFVAGHHAVERAVLSLVDAVGAVDVLGSVDRQPDEEVVLGAPFGGRNGLIGGNDASRASNAIFPREGVSGIGRTSRPILSGCCAMVNLVVEHALRNTIALILPPAGAAG